MRRSRAWARPWRRRVISAATLLGAACARPTAPPPLGQEPRIRIGIVTAADAVSVGGGAELLLTRDDGQPLGRIAAGQSWRAVREGPLVRLVAPDGTRTEPAQWINAVPVTEGRFAVVNDRGYRGSLEVLPRGGGFAVVNVVRVEDYLLSVVGGELGRRTEAERAAARAQAVVSRTFALRHRGLRRADGFDLYGDVRDQVYGGVATEHGVSNAAVRATTGQVLLYRGELIDAYFFSTCGYRTAAVREAFRTATERPYLRPVSDRVGGDRYYCDISPRFRWREEWDGATLGTILRATLPAVTGLAASEVGVVRRVEVTETGRSGRVTVLAIDAGERHLQIVGPDVRRVLRPASDRVLGSTAFQLHDVRENGRVTRLVAAGAGWGHGVGFCQWGAVGRARAGQDYRTIVTTYFPGTNLARLY